MHVGTDLTLQHKLEEITSGTQAWPAMAGIKSTT
jgi:hypothetical protein